MIGLKTIVCVVLCCAISLVGLWGGMESRKYGGAHKPSAFICAALIFVLAAVVEGWEV